MPDLDATPSMFRVRNCQVLRLVYITVAGHPAVP